MQVQVTNVSVDEVLILIHENALNEMKLSRARIIRRMQQLSEDLAKLDKDILTKQTSITRARETFYSKINDYS